jgi:hypothetical protein
MYIGIDVSSLITKYYENFYDLATVKNKAKQSQFIPKVMKPIPHQFSACHGCFLVYGQYLVVFKIGAG